MAGRAAILEREDELESIDAALADAGEARGRIVLVEGPPGIGKSRLLTAARDRAIERAFAVRSARAAELERELPFEVARQLFGRSIEPRDDVLAAGGDRGFDLLRRFHDALLGSVYPSPEAAARPTLLVVDDAQWSDRSSLRFLTHVALRLDDLPVLLLVAVRSGEAGDHDELLAPLRTHPLARRLSPRPLSDAAMAQLVHAALGDAGAGVVAACARTSGGNPFYLVELLAELQRSGTPTVEAIGDAAPATVLTAIVARLGRARQAAIALASAIAVLEAPTPLSVAAALADIPLADAEVLADELARAHVLGPGEPVRFTHPLIASTLRRDIGPFVRSRLHRRAAELLDRAGAPVQRVATHLLHAPAAADAEVVARLRRAAALARGSGDPLTATVLLRRALEEPPESGLRGELLLELGEAQAMAGSPDAERTLEKALAAVGPRRRVEASVSLARTLHHAGRFAQAAALADGCRAGLAADDPLREPLLAAWLGSALLDVSLRDRVPGELAPFAAAAHRNELPGDPALCAQLAAWMSSTDEPVELVRTLAEAAFASDPLVDGDARGAALGYAASALVDIDALDTAGPLLLAAEEAGRARGTAIAVAIARHYLAYVHLHAGPLEDAIVAAERSLEFYRHGWTASAWSTPVLARAHLERGDVAAAAEAIAVGECADPNQAERAMLLEARAALHLAVGRPGEALEHARAAGRISEGTYGVTSARGFDWVRLAAVAAHAAGNGKAARAYADEAVARARAGRVPRQLGRALASAGAIVGGDAGVALLREGVAVLADSPSRLERAHALLALGAALRRAGKRTAARDELLGALELADELSIPRAVATAREELRALGLRPRRGARSGVAALTASERRVAELVARELSTRQVAVELYVTNKTVESHLTQIYRKLDIAGRGELAEALGAGSAPAADAGAA